MKSKKSFFLMLLVLLGAVAGIACGVSKENTSEEEQEQEKQIEIGMSFDTFVVERWQRDRDIFVSTANELGADVKVQNANGNAAEQIKQLQYFIDKHMDVIVVVPIDADSLSEVIEKAKDQGIKVISYDRMANHSNVDFYISFDNEAVGHLMGMALEKELTVGDNVLMVSGPLTDNNVNMVNEGFEQEMRKAGINVIDTAYMDDWKAELAYDYINQNMEAIRAGKVQGIMCGNDNLASRVIYALSENRLAGSIIVCGQDADLDACQRIVEGTQFMTVYKPVNLLAEKVAQLAVALAEGKEVEADDTISDGTYEIPYLSLIPNAVNADNMDDIIIGSGFHLREDVYIDRPINPLELPETMAETEEDIS